MTGRGGRGHGSCGDLRGVAVEDVVRLVDVGGPPRVDLGPGVAQDAEDALLASGTIPLLCAPVRDVAGAPPGNYWDGALVDYHLLLPYPRLALSGDPAQQSSPRYR